MNYWSVILSLLFASAVFAQEKLYSKELQSQICNGIEKKFNESKNQCENGTFVFAKNATTQMIGNQQVAVQITVDASFEGKTYSALLNADLSVNADGQVVRKGWLLSEVFLSSISDEALLEMASTNSQNVQPADIAALPLKIQNVLNSFEDSERSYFDDADDWEDGARDYFIVKNKKGDVIGYLMTDSWMSETVDVKIFFTLRFNKEGVYLSSESESFGYYE